jgi:hypothetical protein
MRVNLYLRRCSDEVPLRSPSCSDCDQPSAAAFSPSAAHCCGQSIGRSIRRLTPYPRDSRPSIAARTGSGKGMQATEFCGSNAPSCPRVPRAFDCLIGAPRQVIEPTMSVAKRVDEDRARFGSHRPHSGGLFARASDDLAAPLRRRRHPGNDEDAILVISHSALGKLDLDRRSGDDDALDSGAQFCVAIDSAKARIGKVG